LRAAAVLSVVFLLAGSSARAQEPEYDGKPLGHWVEELRAGHARSARAAFAAMGPRAADAVPALLALLEDGDAGSQAAECLGLIGRPAVPGLLKALDNESDAVRRNAADAACPSRRRLARCG
jgi:hypothetical protein